MQERVDVDNRTTVCEWTGSVIGNTAASIAHSRHTNTAGVTAEAWLCMRMTAWQGVGRSGQVRRCVMGGKHMQQLTCTSCELLCSPCTALAVSRFLVVADTCVQAGRGLAHGNKRARQRQ